MSCWLGCLGPYARVVRRAYVIDISLDLFEDDGRVHAVLCVVRAVRRAHVYRRMRFEFDHLHYINNAIFAVCVSAPRFPVCLSFLADCNMSRARPGDSTHSRAAAKKVFSVCPTRAREFAAITHTMLTRLDGDDAVADIRAVCAPMLHSVCVC